MIKSSLNYDKPKGVNILIILGYVIIIIVIALQLVVNQITQRVL